MGNPSNGKAIKFLDTQINITVVFASRFLLQNDFLSPIVWIF